MGIVSNNIFFLIRLIQGQNGEKGTTVSTGVYFGAFYHVVQYQIRIRPTKVVLLKLSPPNPFKQFLAKII